MAIPTIIDEFDEEEEVFVFTVPEGGDPEDELVYPILPKDEAHAILDADL
jgi:hypothetical protein